MTENLYALEKKSHAGQHGFQRLAGDPASIKNIALHHDAAASLGRSETQEWFEVEPVYVA